MADFTNIDGKFAKDTELRSGIDTLRTTVLSNTIKPLTVTKNDTYTAIPSSGTYGYSPIIVDVQEEPWAPLQDGYSNFWFELTNDTLSPWLNFSAKNADATIDWGDGSGEVALDTLTPTHTYSKAGKYVVKVKGVTGIGMQHTSPLTLYAQTLKYIEFNDDISTVEQKAFQYCLRLKGISVNKQSYLCFQYCVNLKNAVLSTNNIGSVYNTCTSLESATITDTVTSIGTYTFAYCLLLSKVILPSTIQSIGNYAFITCISLAEIHCQATTPPSLGTGVFNSLPSNFIIYVPVGTGDTYKSASGWSTYADHILEEGETPTRAMLAKFNSDNTDNEEMR